MELKSQNIALVYGIYGTYHFCQIKNNSNKNITNLIKLNKK